MSVLIHHPVLPDPLDILQPASQTTLDSFDQRRKEFSQPAGYAGCHDFRGNQFRIVTELTHDGNYGVGHRRRRKAPCPMAAQNPVDFPQPPIAAGRRLGVAVDPAGRQYPVGIAERKTLADPNPQLPVEPPVQFLVQQAAFEQRLAAEKHRRLQNIIGVIRQPPQVERHGFREAPHDAAVFSHQIPLAIDQGDLRIVLQYLDRMRDRARIIKIVGIEPGDILAATAAEPFVDRVALATVGRAAEPDFIPVTFQDFSRPIVAAAIEDQNFHGIVILGQDAVDGSPQVFGLLIGGDDDADQWVQLCSNIS